MGHWWQSAVVYQVYPRSFQDSNGDGIGDLCGVTSRLDYLEKLGVDVIWLSPVYESPNDDNGYDVSDYYQIMSEFGTMADMRELIAAAKKHHIRIVMDLVLNHTSDEHAWFVESRRGKDNTYRDYYVWRDAVDGHAPNGLPAAWNDSAWELDTVTNQYYLHLFSKKQPDLNWTNPAVRNSLYKMINYWIDMGIGGFRLDVIDAIGKLPDKPLVFNGPQLHDYLQEMNRATFGNKDLLTVGETGSATPAIAKLYSGENRQELSMVFQFEHMLLDQGESKFDLQNFSVPNLKSILSKWQVELGAEGWNSLYWNNHDQPRIVSRWGDDKQYRVRSAKAFAILLHLMKGTPYVYQGEEIGMTNYPFSSITQVADIESLNYYSSQVAAGEDVKKILARINVMGRDNARTPMQWDDTRGAGFTKGKPWLAINANYSNVNVEAALSDPESVFFTYQRLIRLRHTTPLIVWGEYNLEDSAPNVFAYTRRYKNQRWLIVVNLSKDINYYTLKQVPTRVIIQNIKRDLSNAGDIYLAPYEAFVVELEA
ncbi:MAG: alpha-glucosidase [Lactobacillus sp.]|nr:alpha-glucosidase [Lactobacillus sp.]MCI2031918.1 alpha-glucosidase [Lactobacillus sp.]